MTDMHARNLVELDLNLLVVVEAVLRTRSATRAAFGDRLVVRNGRGFSPTPRAEALAPGLRALLAGVRGLLGEGAEFVPETTTREFTIACIDAVGLMLLPRLLPLLHTRCPRAR